jgi:hypothetical protein
MRPPITRLPIMREPRAAVSPIARYSLTMHRPLAIAMLCVAASAAACSSAQQPELRIVGVELAERTDDAAVVNFIVEGRNPNPVDPLPMGDIDYSLTIDRTRVFAGSRQAMAALPPDSTQRFVLPAVIPAAALPPPGVTARARYRLAGDVVYELPGTIAELLFDNDIRRPTAPLSRAGSLELGPAAARDPHLDSAPN